MNQHKPGFPSKGQDVQKVPFSKAENAAGGHFGMAQSMLFQHPARSLAGGRLIYAQG
jgi:hypothetical protein